MEGVAIGASMSGGAAVTSGARVTTIGLFVGSSVLVAATVGVVDGTNVSFKSITTGATARLGPGLVVFVVLLGSFGTAVTAPIGSIIVGDIVVAFVDGLGAVVLDDTRSGGAIVLFPSAAEQFADAKIE